MEEVVDDEKNMAAARITSIAFAAQMTAPIHETGPAAGGEIRLVPVVAVNAGEFRD